MKVWRLGSCENVVGKWEGVWHEIHEIHKLYEIQLPQNPPTKYEIHCLKIEIHKIHKNSSGDEIANVNVFTTISHTYFKTPKKEPISFNKLDDSQASTAH